MNMMNALMPGDDNWMRGQPMPGQGQPAPAPMAAPQKKRPIMNALRGYFQTETPEAYQAGVSARSDRDMRNALSQEDYAGASRAAMKGGNYEAGFKLKEYSQGQDGEARKREAQGVAQLFSNMQPLQINEYAMSDPSGFEQMTGMTSEEYLQTAQRLQQAGMTPEQVHGYVLQKAQAEAGMTGGEGYTLAPGAARYDAAGNLIANNPAAEKPQSLPSGMQMGPNGAEWIPGYLEAQERLRRSGASQITVSTGDVAAGQRPIVDKPDKGFQRVWDEASQSYRDEPIPGGDSARSREEEAIREYLKLQTSEFNYDNVTSEIDRAIGLADYATAGVGGALLRELPMTSARTLNNAITMVKSNLGFDRLQQMREESKTGGALGAVTEKEIDLLQSTVQRLDQLTDPAELVRALEVVKEQYIKVQTLRQQMYAMKYSTTEPGQSRPTPAASTPVTSSDLPPGFEMVP